MTIPHMNTVRTYRLQKLRSSLVLGPGAIFDQWSSKLGLYALDRTGAEFEIIGLDRLYHEAAFPRARTGDEAQGAPGSDAQARRKMAGCRGICCVALEETVERVRSIFNACIEIECPAGGGIWVLATTSQGKGSIWT
jgi:hypothetical protein